MDLGRLVRRQRRAPTEAQARIDQQAFDQHEDDRRQHQREPEQLADDLRAVRAGATTHGWAAAGDGLASRLKASGAASSTRRINRLLLMIATALSLTAAAGSPAGRTLAE